MFLTNENADHLVGVFVILNIVVIEINYYYPVFHHHKNDVENLLQL
jgi:phosphoribosyl 1,2-cyclic phosphodiesterase